ncbi:MAG TPA: hypothetical protein VEL05_12140 [Candidatus Acidoferrum sp.]|nr:hypothetical protein [Candidatus Acidoferrum sp.]
MASPSPSGAGAVVLGQEAAAAKLFLHAPDRTLQHLAHLAALQVAERLPDEIGALLVVGAIESDQVQMRVEAEIRRGALQDGDRAGLRAAAAIPRRALGVERVQQFQEGGILPRPGRVSPSS